MNLYASSYANPIYNSWKDMRKRCYNPRRRDYKWYGGLGITVCDEWNKSFQAFATDMAPSWFIGGTLNRIHGTGNYCKSNCNWITMSEQQLNRSNVKGYWIYKDTVLELLREGKSRSEISRFLGLPYEAVSRIARGEGPCV
jgi:hypothetical protein